MANPEAFGLAAGAMSKAIADIYKGQLEATTVAPGIEEHAQAKAARAMEMAQKMQKFPLEMQEARQKIGLGEYALQEAPLKIKQLKGTLEGQDLDRQLKDIQVKSTGDAYTIQVQSREAARKFITANKMKPGMEWIAAYESNPDAFIDAYTKIQTELAKAAVRPQSVDQRVSAIMASGGPKTPKEAEMVKKYWDYRMKTGARAAGGMTAAQQTQLKKELYKEANDAMNQLFQAQFGKDFTKLPGTTQQQKNDTLQYYKIKTQADIWDSNPAFKEAGIPRPIVPPKPAWVAQYETGLTAQKTWRDYVPSWVPGFGGGSQQQPAQPNTDWKIIPKGK